MENRSRTEYSLLNIIAGVGGYIINTVLGFICRMVFVQCLAADYLGVNGLFTNILSMLSLKLERWNLLHICWNIQTSPLSRLLAITVMTTAVNSPVHFAQ